MENDCMRISHESDCRRKERDVRAPGAEYGPQTLTPPFSRSSHAAQITSDMESFIETFSLIFLD